MPINGIPTGFDYLGNFVNAPAASGGDLPNLLALSSNQTPVLNSYTPVFPPLVTDIFGGGPSPIGSAMRPFPNALNLPSLNAGFTQGTNGGANPSQNNSGQFTPNQDTGFGTGDPVSTTGLNPSMATSFNPGFSTTGILSNSALSGGNGLGNPFIGQTSNGFNTNPNAFNVSAFASTDPSNPQSGQAVGADVSTNGQDASGAAGTDPGAAAGADPGAAGAGMDMGAGAPMDASGGCGGGDAGGGGC